jgi:magnesium transporter
VNEKKSNLVFRPDKLILSGLNSLIGSSPGQFAKAKSSAKGNARLSYIGEERQAPVEIQLYAYDAQSCELKENVKAFEWYSELKQDTNYWLNFHGIHEVERLEKLADALKIDRLTLRQILDTTQRPKVEEYEGYLHFMIKSILSNERGEIMVEHMSFILAPQIVISFQEEHGDHFDDIRHKIDTGVGFIRKRSTDYLLSQLLDAILDNYFETIEAFNQEIGHYAPEMILEQPKKEMIVALEAMKKRAQIIKKSLFPFKEAIQSILNERTKLISEPNIKYFRDLSSNSSAAIDEIDESLRTLEGLTNIYFASESQKMNDIMRVLTTVSTIFIPLTFIAGIYGMNFQYMPELAYRWGYFIILGVMGLTTLGMLYFFKRKRWL